MPRSHCIDLTRTDTVDLTQDRFDLTQGESDTGTSDSSDDDSSSCHIIATVQHSHNDQKRKRKRKKRVRRNKRKKHKRRQQQLNESFPHGQQQPPSTASTHNCVNNDNAPSHKAKQLQQHSSNQNQTHDKYCRKKTNKRHKSANHRITDRDSNHFRHSSHKSNHHHRHNQSSSPSPQISQQNHQQTNTNKKPRHQSTTNQIKNHKNRKTNKNHKHNKHRPNSPKNSNNHKKRALDTSSCMQKRNPHSPLKSRSSSPSSSPSHQTSQPLSQNGQPMHHTKLLAHANADAKAQRAPRTTNTTLESHLPLAIRSTPLSATKNKQYNQTQQPNNKPHTASSVAAAQATTTTTKSQKIHTAKSPHKTPPTQALDSQPQTKQHAPPPQSILQSDHLQSRNPKHKSVPPFLQWIQPKRNIYVQDGNHGKKHAATVVSPPTFLSGGTWLVEIQWPTPAATQIPVWVSHDKCFPTETDDKCHCRHDQEGNNTRSRNPDDTHQRNKRTRVPCDHHTRRERLKSTTATRSLGPSLVTQNAALAKSAELNSASKSRNNNVSESTANARPNEEMDNTKKQAKKTNIPNHVCAKPQEWKLNQLNTNCPTPVHYKKQKSLCSPPPVLIVQDERKPTEEKGGTEDTTECNGQFFQVGTFSDVSDDDDEDCHGENTAFYPMNSRISKDFFGESYGGRIVSFDSEMKWYKVLYDDGDVEEMDQNEVGRHLVPKDKVAGGKPSHAMGSTSTVNTASPVQREEKTAKCRTSTKARSGESSVGPLNRPNSAGKAVACGTQRFVQNFTGEPCSKKTQNFAAASHGRDDYAAKWNRSDDMEGRSLSSGRSRSGIGAFVCKKASGEVRKGKVISYDAASKIYTVKYDDDTVEVQDQATLDRCLPIKSTNEEHPPSSAAVGSAVNDTCTSSKKDNGKSFTISVVMKGGPSMDATKLSAELTFDRSCMEEKKSEKNTFKTGTRSKPDRGAASSSLLSPHQTSATAAFDGTAAQKSYSMPRTSSEVEDFWKGGLQGVTATPIDDNRSFSLFNFFSNGSDCGDDRFIAGDLASLADSASKAEENLSCAIEALEKGNDHSATQKEAFAKDVPTSSGHAVTDTKIQQSANQVISTTRLESGSDSSNSNMKESASSVASMPSLYQIHSVPESKIAQIQDMLPLAFCRSASKQQLRKISMQVGHFFLFCHERQLIWTRRKSGQASPWTSDECLQSGFFCNIYRELDRGTAYFRSTALSRWKIKKKSKMSKSACVEPCLVEEIVWSSLCYRLLNKSETFKRLGGIPTMLQWPEFSKKLRKLKASSTKYKLFTGAHQVMGYDRYVTTMNKLLENECASIKKVTKALKKAIAKRDMHLVFRELVSINNVGTFYAWQVMCDLLESQVLRPFTENDWVVLGPGAREGLERIFSLNAPAKKSLYWVRFLVSRQYKVFSALGVQFPYFNQKRLTLKNIEHALCEFEKYCKMQKIGTTKRTWRLKTKNMSGSSSAKKCEVCKNLKQTLDTCATCLCLHCADCDAETLELGKKCKWSSICKWCKDFENTA